MLGPFEICYLFLFHFNSTLVVHSFDVHFLEKSTQILLFPKDFLKVDDIESSTKYKNLF